MFYVIQWESHVNSCHLRFSCLEFYADITKVCAIFLGHLKVIFRPLEVMTPRSHFCLSSHVAHQKDRNCLGNIKMKKHFQPARGHLRSTIPKFPNIPISLWARNGHHAPPPPTIHPHQFFLSCDMSKT